VNSWDERDAKTHFSKLLDRTRKVDRNYEPRLIRRGNRWHVSPERLPNCQRVSAEDGCLVLYSIAHSNCSTTISGLDPSRSGGPQVPAPLEVKTCIFPIRLRPYTNCR